MKLARNPFFLIGLIFACVGSIFVIVGASIFAAFYFNGGSMTVNGIPVYYEPGTVGEGSLLFLGIFGGMGLIFVVLGVIFLVVAVNRYKAIKALLEEGRYVTARVIDVIQNRSVRINGRFPYKIICQYDGNYGGAPHVFESDNIINHPGDIMNYFVKVYVDKSNWNLYYVDDSSLMNSAVL